MDVFNLLLRHAMPNDIKCAPYALWGSWPDYEAEHIKNRILRTHPNQVHPTFNNWILERSYGDGDLPKYSARLSTWTTGLYSSTRLDDVLDAIDIQGAHWSLAMLEEIFPDSCRITSEEAIALPFASYQRDLPDYRHGQRGIWLIDRPHVSALLHTYDDPNTPHSRIFYEQMIFRGVRIFTGGIRQ